MGLQQIHHDGCQDGKHHDGYKVADAYFHQGEMAEKEKNFTKAESCYRKALEIYEGQEDEDGIFYTCFHLGKLAEEQGKSAEMEKFYEKVLMIDESRNGE